MTIKLDLNAEDLIREMKDYNTYIKRSLMSFDKLNRLVKPAAGKKVQNTDNKDHVSIFEKVVGMAQMVVDKAVQFRDTFWNLLENGRTLEQKLEYLPTALQRVSGRAYDVLLTMIGLPDAIDDVTGAMREVRDESLITAELLGMMPEEIGDSFARMKNGMSDFPLWLVYNFAIPVQKNVTAAFADILPTANSTLDQMKQMFVDYSVRIFTVVRDIWDNLQDKLSGTDGVIGTMGGGVVNAVKNAVNRVISGMNEVLIAPFSSLNDSFSKLKSFSIGGVQPFKNFNFALSVPKIPMLAQGAVLPANKPFLAVLGDQKQGTNIEAPLSTIQQAVADVMGDMIEAEMAGHNATVSVLTRILEAVMGIRLDEGAVGRAVGAYTLQQNMMTGGL